MTIYEMLEQSAVLTILGMLTVFVFLAVMVFCIDLAGKIINRFSINKDKETQTPEILVAITAAVNEYRHDKIGAKQ